MSIAEVKNAGHTELESIKGSDVMETFSNFDPDKATIDAFIAPLKIALPNAQITTYTYDPLVGMTSQTDAKGQTTYFEYDDFQRLKHVKDQSSNIMKSNIYHYKLQ